MYQIYLKSETADAQMMLTTKQATLTQQIPSLNTARYTLVSPTGSSKIRSVFRAFSRVSMARNDIK